MSTRAAVAAAAAARAGLRGGDAATAAAAEVDADSAYGMAGVEGYTPLRAFATGCGEVRCRVDGWFRGGCGRQRSS